jgi:hypothetical protein
MATEGRQNSASGETINVEFYTQSEVLSGHITCPLGFRLLDLFNDQGQNDENSTSEFIELVNTSKDIKWNSFRDAPKEYLRKTSIYMVAVPDAETARGLGAKGSQKTYPFVVKLPRTVNIEMMFYSIAGTAYLPEGQTLRELLNERARFLPLTDVTITRNHHLFATRPFCIVNKDQIVSMKEQNYNQPITYNL